MPRLSWIFAYWWLSPQEIMPYLHKDHNKEAKVQNGSGSRKA